MSTALIERLQSERTDLVAYVERTLEGVEGRDLSESEMRSVQTTKERIEQIDAQARPLAEFMQTRDAAADLTAHLGRSEKRERKPSAEVRSLGEQFVESDVFRDYRGRGTSSRFMGEMRALPTGLSEVADLLPKPGTRVDITAPVYTPLLDAISTVQVSSNAIETVVWAKTGGADVVAEKAAKPSVEFTPTVTPITLDTIAGYTQMTRQMMEDAPAVRDSINGQLRRDVALKMEAEAAAALVAATLPTATAANLLAAIRTGVGTVQAAGYNPNVVILNPADWAALDIDVFDSTLNGPTVGQRFWGLRPISAVAQPAGTATVADLGAGVQRYARSGVSLYVTDSHGDTFLSNVFTILAEGRASTVVTRPAAFAECSVA